MAARSPKPPAAFLSYTRFDDRYHHGAISGFREQLSMAVRAVTAQPFEIFQDVDGIGLGEVWREALDERLDEARFFIPVLTPSYFGSKACRDELNKFAELERRSGRSDLIPPIYYLTCTVLEDKQQCAADPLATLIDGRQRWDWRDLRHHSFRTRKVKLELEALANRVDDARRRAKPTKTEAEPKTIEEDAEKRFTGTARNQTRQHLEVGTVSRDVDAWWCPELVVIPSGEFMMGSADAERGRALEQGLERESVDPEKPRHLVRIAYPLAVGRFPVTCEQYDHFARATGRDHPAEEGPGGRRRPVINVSWEDAKVYAGWLADETGRPYRLLSEAEWEYACRAGTTTRYWWGDKFTRESPAQHMGLFEAETSEVGKYRANPWGLYDMHGNVLEWVEDCWNDSFDGAPDNGSPWTIGDCGRRVLRGGSCSSFEKEQLRSAARIAVNAETRRRDIGFRFARTLTRLELLLL